MADFPTKRYLLDYNDTVKAFAKCFRVEPDIIKEKLEQMERSNLLEFSLTATGKKAIKTNHNIKFIDRELGS